MNRKIVLATLAGIILLFHGCCPKEQKYPQGIKHVIVIGIDAMSVEGLKKAATPHMDKLIAKGAFCNHVRAVQPSSSLANWGSMLAGAGTEIHGITSNEWGFEDRSLKPPVVDDAGYFPTVLSVVRAQLPDAEIGMIYHWEGFGDLFEKGLASVDKAYPTEKETAYAIAGYIKAKKPAFVFSQLDDVDGAGHHYGHMTEGYLNAISHVDTLVGVIVQSVKDAGIEKETLIMVVSDHGGIGNSHGGPSWEEITVPFILSGAGVKENYTVPTEVYMYDVAPTITFALGLAEPNAWRGKAVQSAFRGFDAPTDPLNLKRLFSAPLINGGRHMFEQAGGLFIDSDATVTITAEQPGVKIYYTMDGSEPTRQSQEYTQPFALNKTTVVKAKLFSDHDYGESMVAEGYFRILKGNGSNGVQVGYYPGKNWNAIPRFPDMKPTRTWTAHEIRVDDKFINSLPRDDSSFGIVYTGKLQIDREGEYTFFLQSDDGSNLYIDGRQVVNNDGDHGVIEKQGTVTLSPGKHDLRVEFINAGGGYWIEAFYKGPGVPRQIIPADKLYLK